MFRKQLIGFVGALAAVLTLALVWQQRAFFARCGLSTDDTVSRLAYAFRWLLLPGLTLLIGIVGAARRGFYREAIDGTRIPANQALEINLRYNLNTLEQVMLAAIAWTGLALELPHNELVLIPAMAFLFFAGRVTFFIGYLIYPVARAYGMVLTVMPTLIAYGWLSWRLIDGL